MVNQRKEELIKHIQVIVQKELAGKVDIIGRKEFLQKLAETSGYSPSTVTQRFYEVLSKEKKKNELSSGKEDSMTTKKSLDESIGEFIEEQNKMIPPEIQKPKPPYNVGQKVKVRICNIVQQPKFKGAFADILEEPTNYTGLIHISKIANARIENIEDYLYIGQELEAMIVDITLSREGQWNIELSVLHLNLQPLHTPFKELNGLKVQEKEIKINNKPAEELWTNEIKEITKLISSAINQNASEECRELIEQLVIQHGIVKATVAVINTAKEFAPDLSLIFAKEVAKRLDDSL